MIANSYLDRQADVLAFDGFSDGMVTSSVLLDQVLIQPEGGSGKVIAGIGKLAQRFLLELFTEAGTMPYNPQRGCQFLYEARAGVFQTPNDVAGAFARAVTKIGRNLQGEETEDDPDDERYVSATLQSVSVSPARLVLHVALTSRAGSARRILLPVTVSV